MRVTVSHYLPMTWRACSYTFMVLLAIAAIATTASMGIAPDDVTQARTATLAMQAAPQTDPGTRLVLLVAGSLAILFTYRRAIMNMRSRP